MFGLGMPELLLVLVVALILFGSKRLPEIGRSLGQSIAAFKKGLKEGLEDEEKNGDHEASHPSDKTL